MATDTIKKPLTGITTALVLLLAQTSFAADGRAADQAADTARTAPVVLISQHDVKADLKARIGTKKPFVVQEYAHLYDSPADAETEAQPGDLTASK